MREEEEEEVVVVEDEEDEFSTTWNLPEDLVLNVLSRLPVKSILRCRCVCKSWSKSIANPYFTKLQLTRAHQKTPNLLLSSCESFYSLDSDACEEAVKLNLDLPRVYIVGCCNGLLCLSNFKTLVCLWNPSTGEYVQLPDALVNSESPHRKMQNKVMGFGFDPVSEEYKLVVVLYSCVVDESNIITDYDGYEAKIYTLGSNSWRTISDTPSHPCYIGSYSKVAHVNGFLHWVGVRGIGTQLPKSIVCFDVGNEKFGEISWPEFEDSDDVCLGVIQGCLSIFHHFLSERVDIWVMKDYGVKGSWTRMFSIGRSMVSDKFDLLDPLVFLKNGEILLEMDNINLLMYDPVSERARVHYVHNIRSRFRAIDYVESVISIASLMAGKGVERRHCAEIV